MYYGRRKKSRYVKKSKRTYRKKKSYKRPSKAIVRGPGAVCPDHYFVKLKYSATITVSAAATYFNYVFSGNSAYDPDVTSTGSQPTGFDQLCPALYRRFRVRASKIKVTYMNTGSTSGSYTKVALFPSTNSTAISDIQLAASQPYSKDSFVSGNGGNDVKTLSCYMTTKKIFGNRLINDIDYSGTNSADPAQEWYWQLVCNSVDNATNLTSDYMDVVITYYVEFFDRTQLTAS